MHSIHHLQGKIRDISIKKFRMANDRTLSLRKHNFKWIEPSDNKAVYQQIIESAVSVYNQCPDEYVNRKWREIQAHQSGPVKGSWDADLFHLAVEKVIITADTTIHLHLYTGDIMKYRRAI